MLSPFTCVSLGPHTPGPSRLLRPWDFPGNNTGVGCHVLLQGVFSSYTGLDTFSISSVQQLSYIRLFATPWKAARQASFKTKQKSNEHQWHQLFYYLKSLHEYISSLTFESVIRGKESPSNLSKQNTQSCIYFIDLFFPMKIPLRDIYWRTFLHNKNLWQLTSYFMIRMKQLLRNYVMNIFLNCRKIFASCQMADKRPQYYQILLLLRSRSS